VIQSRGGAAIQAHVEAASGPAVDWYQPRRPRVRRGPGSVEAVSLHRVSRPGQPGPGQPGPADHWHLVTYGLTELHAKDSLDRHVSGWGFELTFRLISPDDAPRWAFDFLTRLAAYVWAGGHPFAEGHLMDLRGPVRTDSQSPITAAMIVRDPALDTLAGPFGAVDFLQVVGLTADELELCRAWSVEGVGDLLARDNPMLVTDLDRESVADDPRFTDEIQARVREEGSALHELRIGTLRVTRRRRGGADVQLGSGAAAALGPALRRELLAEGAAFTVVGDDVEVRFTVAAESGWRWVDQGIEASVSPTGVEYVAGLFDGRTGWGQASDWPGIRFRVVR
jgi:hypothetical protein